MTIKIDNRTDILALIDIQPTFMPGGELPVANGNAASVASSAAPTLSLTDQCTRLAAKPIQRGLPAGGSHSSAARS